MLGRMRCAAWAGFIHGGCQWSTVVFRRSSNNKLERIEKLQHLRCRIWKPRQTKLQLARYWYRRGSEMESLEREIYNRRTALLQRAIKSKAKPGQTSCARLAGAGCIVPAFAAILRRLAPAINGLPNREWEPATDIGSASTSRFQDLLPPHVDADRTLTGRLGRRTPGIRNLPICDRQSEPPCIWDSPGPHLVFGDRQWGD